MLIDKRSCRLSNRQPSEEGMDADLDAADLWLYAHGLTSDRYIHYGFSLGGAPATYLTAHPRSLTPQKLILEAPFASTASLTDDATGLNMPSSFVTNLVFDNAKQIKSVNQPFCWMHGTEELFINIKIN